MTLQEAVRLWLERGHQDQEPIKIRERVELKKFDHSVEPPRLIETIVTENGQLIERRSGSGGD